MRAKKIVCFFSVLLLFSGLMYSVDALSDKTVSFRGGGVTIDLTYPEEAHPDTTIKHNVTITANTDLTSINIGILIYAPVNSTLQLIKSQPLSWGTLYENQSLPTSEIPIVLPEQANGTLYCVMTVQTDQTADALSYKFYTTHVSRPTLSEMQSLYYEMLANYTALKDEYDGLWANYTSLFANYTALLSERNQLIADYNSKVATYESLLAQYNKLSGDYNTLDSNYRSQLSKYNALQADYDSLNSTHYSLQANYTTLQAVYDELNQTYNDLLTDLNDLEGKFSDSQRDLNTDKIVMFIFVVTVACLIAFIIYIKRKEPEPYVVIRKETVAMKPDEKS